jgi:hypothetical protein
VRRRLDRYADEIDDLRVDLQGLTSLFGDQLVAGPPSEVRLRVAVRSTNLEVARAAVHEVELLYFGPAGGGGATGSVVPALGVTPAFVPRELVPLTTEVLVS